VEEESSNSYSVLSSWSGKSVVDEGSSALENIPLTYLHPDLNGFLIVCQKPPLFSLLSSLFSSFSPESDTIGASRLIYKNAHLKKIIKITKIQYLHVPEGLHLQNSQLQYQ